MSCIGRWSTLDSVPNLAVGQVGKDVFAGIWNGLLINVPSLPIPASVCCNVTNIILRATNTNLNSRWWLTWIVSLASDGFHKR